MIPPARLLALPGNTELAELETPQRAVQALILPSARLLID